MVTLVTAPFYLFCCTKMDKQLHRYDWYISETLKVSDFRNKWLATFAESIELLDEIVDEPSENESNKDEGNSKNNSTDCILNKIPKHLIEELEETCRDDTLKCEGETSDYIFVDISLMKSEDVLPHIATEHNLMTLSFQENELKKRWSNEKYRKSSYKNMKHSNAERLLLPQVRSEDNEIQVPVDPREVVLSVIVCRPTKLSAKYTIKKGGEKYLVLGNQKLTEFRDVISCPLDLQPTGDYSTDPRISNSEIAKNVYKSGFFFINGVFYNDMRCHTSVDYSKAIREWMHDNPDSVTKFGTCTSESMAETKFNDLNFKIGYPYLYMHQGNCEHFIIFSDVRLIDASDSINQNHYPLCYSSRQVKGVRCMMCWLFPPKWITKGHKRVHADPFLFCGTCFYSFNYDAHGQKIGEFQAHPYVNL